MKTPIPIAEHEIVIDGVTHRVRVFAAQPLDRELREFMAARDDSRGPAQRLMRDAAPRKPMLPLPWA